MPLKHPLTPAMERLFNALFLRPELWRGKRKQPFDRARLLARRRVMEARWATMMKFAEAAIERGEVKNIPDDWRTRILFDPIWSGEAVSALECLGATIDQDWLDSIMPPHLRRGAARPVTFYDSPEWLELRYCALKRHGGACQCCGAKATKGHPLHVDHIKPRSKYPHLELELDNLQVLCEDCNLGKSNKDETDWRPVSAA